jgi:hypothetical protein
MSDDAHPGIELARIMRLLSELGLLQQAKDSNSLAAYVALFRALAQRRCT